MMLSAQPPSAAAQGDACSSLREAGVRSIAILSADSETLVSFRGHLIDTLLASGISVIYLGPAVDAVTREWLASRMIPQFEIPISRNSVAPFADFRTMLALWRALRSRQPDAVIATRPKTTVYGLLAARLAGVRYRLALVTGLGYAFVERPGDWKWRTINVSARALFRQALRGITAVAFQNHDDRKDFANWRLVSGDAPTTVVNGSGVDLVRYAEAAVPASPHCLFTGRLLADKGLREFIEAARIVRRKRPDVSFTVLGPAETNPAAFPVTALEEAEREGVIRYGGAADDVRPYIAASTIFVLPSFYREGVPRSILEAMAMSRPIVTTDVPGCRDTVEHGRNGLIVPPRDAEALASAILELVENPSRAAAMGKESRRIAEERYEVGNVTRDLLEFFGASASRHGR